MKFSGNHLDSGNRRGWRQILALIKIVVSAGLLGFLVYSYEFAETFDQLAALDHRWLVVVCILFTILVILSAIRWRIILQTLNVSITFGTAVAVTTIGMFFNQVLPSNLGGDVMRIWRIRQFGAKLGSATESVVLDRIVAIAALLLLVVLMLPAALEIIEDKLILSSLALVTAAVGVMLTMLLSLDWIAAHTLRRIFPAWVIDAVSALGRNTRTVLLDVRTGLAVVGLAVIAQVLIVVMTLSIAYGLGMKPSFVEFIVLIPPIIFVSVLPISFAGWGVREGAMIAMLNTIGIGPSQALALSVALGMVMFIGSLPGGAVWLLTANRTDGRSRGM